MVFLVLYLFPYFFDIWEAVNAKLKWLSVYLKRCLQLRIKQLVLFFWSRGISIRHSPSCIFRAPLTQIRLNFGFRLGLRFFFFSTFFHLSSRFWVFFRLFAQSPPRILLFCVFFCLRMLYFFIFPSSLSP